MTRVLLLGPSGMLGRAIRSAEVDGVEVVPCTARLSLNFHEACRTLAAINFRQYDAVINTIGIRPETNWTDATMAHVNGLLPHIVAEYTQETRLINVSTDCVFSGGWLAPVRRESGVNTPNPDTLYGRTKLAGESEHAINVRTSFVGPRHGLWKWFVDERRANPEGTVDGWSNAWWSGSTVMAVAHALLELARDPGEPRVLHLATETPISKFELLCILQGQLAARDYALDGSVVEAFEPRIDRSLAPDIVLPPFDQALREMVP